MRAFLRSYSDILLLREETFRAVKGSAVGVPFALLIFLTATLLAGGGKWLGLPAAMNRPLLTERIDRAINVVNWFDRDVSPDLQSSLQSLSRDNLSFQLGDVLPPAEEVTSAGLATAITRAGVSSQTLLVLVNQQVSLSQSFVDDWVGQPVSAEMIDAILAATGLSAGELRGLLLQAAAERPFSPTGTGGVIGVLTNPQELIVALALTPERVRDITVQLGLDPATVDRLSRQVDETPGFIESSLLAAQSAVETVQPPAGTRTSRFMTLFGEWLSTPFTVLLSYLPLTLVALLMARVLGGRATIQQHLIAVALSVAPTVLLFLVYAPDLTASIPLTAAFSVRLVGRLMGLIGIAWAAIILLKSLAIAHDFSYWRSAGTLALAYVMLYVVVPMVGLFVLQFVF